MLAYLQVSNSGGIGRLKDGSYDLSLVTQLGEVGYSRKREVNDFKNVDLIMSENSILLFHQQLLSNTNCF